TTFNNNGSYTKSGAGTTTVSTAFNNTNTVAGTGVVAVNAGSLLLTGGLTNFSGSTLTGGRFAVVGASTLSFNGANVVTNAADIVLDGVGSQILNASTSANGLANLASNTAAGRFSILNGRNFTTAGAFANAGVVSVGAASTFTTNGAFTNATGAELQMAGGSFAATSLGSAGTVVGFGTVSPAVANSGTVRAGGGTLTLAAGAQGAAGTVAVNPGATLALGAASTAGNLLHNGTLLALGASSITVFGDYDNAGFGVGNAFDRRANVSGSGQILAAGSVQQQLGGADVSGGTTANATLALPTIRVGQGGISSSFTVLNAGSGSPSLRGAIVTTGISNAGLSGSGVTAQNWGAIAQGGPGQSFTVSFDPAFGQALSGQVLQLVNNFDNVAGQTLTITGQAFNLAAASPATPNPVVLANQRVGGTLSQALAISNTAPASGFSESLNATIAASGTATAGGSFSLLAAGATSTALFVGVDTATAGAKSGVATITLASDGTGTSGFSPFALTAQTVDVSGSVYRLASASSVTPSPVVLANQRVGGTLSQALTFINTAAADGFSERLNATIAASGTATAGGSFSLLAAGATSTALFVGIDTTTAGAKGGVATITLASDGTGTSGFSPFALTAQTVDVSGSVYRLASASAVTPSPVVLANQRVGGTLSQALTFINTAAADGFSERLNGSISASGTVTAGGSFSLLAAGATSTALFVGVDTATAGAKSGVATITLASDGTGTSGFSPLALTAQTVDVSGSVYRLASASAVTPSPVVLADQRVGGTLRQSLTLGNTATADGFSERLSASLTALGDAVATGSISLLAAGSSSTALAVGIDATTAGAKSGSVLVTLASDGAGTSGFAPFALPSQSLTVTGNVYRLAQPVVDTTPLVLASRVGGPTLQAGIGIVNVAPDAFTERLNARIAASPAGTVPGADLVLNPGASGNLALTLPTTTAGLFSGTVDVALVSSSAGTTSGAPDAPLGTTPVSFTGRVYAPAMAQVGALVVDFGIVRVGDTVAARSLSVGNTATGALTDTLRASLSGGGAPFTAGGTVAGLAAGATDTTGLQVQLATGTAGVFSGQAQVQLTSQNPHLADLPLTAVDVTLQAQVNALARGVLSLAGGGASFSGSGTSYTLDFGTVFTDAVSLSASLVLGNAATGTADALAGGWNLGAGGGAFSLTGFDSFAGLAAGGTLGGLTVSFDIGTEGTFDRVIVLNTLSTNGSGPNLALDDITLHLQGQVVPIPEPGTYLMMALGLLAIGGMGWRRQRAQRD
ncbi:MAG: choice-of-anchor D domain-containing protein, partial [Burkholderiaceae bacterium]|nr:choice-of-anchor D domain-containing protein [Burkholderiaceae bacterium]